MTLVAPEIRDGESQDLSLRPTASVNILVNHSKRKSAGFIHAARKRGQAMDHVLLVVLKDWANYFGQYFANELAVPLRSSSGPVVKDRGSSSNFD